MKIRLFEVGGSIRDALLGYPIKDRDYAVEAPSWDEMRKFILAQGCKIFLEKPEYFTMRAKHPVLGAVDFALCRKDGSYTDGRHPNSVEPASIIEDLSRRDFTFNAMALDVETGETLDPFDGADACRTRMIRAVGNPYERLAEDRLRAFRAVRFAVTKWCSIDGDLDQAISDLKFHAFGSVSAERILEEVTKMFAYDVQKAMDYLFNTFPVLGRVMFANGIVLKPHLKKLTTG